MKIESFLRLVEIQTKVASVIPYLLGTLYALFEFGEIKITQTIILFAAMIIFDMTVTAINNYVDYVKAVKKEGYGYETHNAIVKYQLKPKNVLRIIIIMLLISSALGMFLVYKTDFIILIIGVICFVIGILYSFGPIPISRTPFGEIFSGFTMGGLITFLATYVNIFDKDIVGMQINNNIFSININMSIIFTIILISIPAIAGIANIMLANNICDIEDDIVNKRYTLPVFIGKDNALKVFRWTYYVAFVSIVIGVIIKILPIISLLALISIKPISKNIKMFMNIQSKKDTFVLSVKNFVIMNILYISTIAVGYMLVILK